MLEYNNLEKKFLWHIASEDVWSNQLNFKDNTGWDWANYSNAQERMLRTQKSHVKQRGGCDFNSILIYWYNFKI